MVKAKEPVAEQWYPLNLGSTCHDDPTTRFYSLRYEFKPASIDVSRPGTLHNSAENKVTVEFFNNQAGKPKVGFQGNSEECKELDAVLFFDGKSFRLERMHRAVKSLRHIRQPGESSAAAQGLNLKDNDPDEDANGNGVERISTSQVAEKSLKKPPVAPIQRQSEKIESEEILPAPTKPDPPAGKKKANKKPPAEPKTKSKKAASPAAPASPPERKREREPSPVNVDVDDEKDYESPTKKATPEEELEVEELVEELSEYEEVDISEDEEDKTGVDQTAASLRAQAAAGAEQIKPSSSSSSSGSGSSGSGSGSSSSDSGSDEEDSASSADDGDI